jgi:two-component system OmpR family response regulator
MAQTAKARVLVVEDDMALATGLARGLAQAGFAVTLCSSGERALAAARRGAMIDPAMRILIVEDDDVLGSGLMRILQAEGYAVDLMPRGEQAVLAAGRERFDLVILDVGLPGMDGFEVLRRLREGAQRMPVLVLTARDTVDDRVHGLDLGADDYMAKPFAMPELVARVRALIRRSQAQSGPRVVHGPLTLDTVARRAFLRGAPLDLAAREWAVLEVLLARVERIVSKESIIQAVASWGDELSPNAIEVYVSRLRAKLEPAGIRIRTVRGFGYMLEEFAEAQ